MAAAVHLVAPDGVDDPTRPSGGNTYDRRLREGLASLGWQVVQHPVPGAFPEPSAIDRSALAGLVAALPDGVVLLVDGLVAATVPDVLVPAAERLALVVLVHMPVEGAAAAAVSRERSVLAAAAAVLVPSAWTRDRLVEHYGLPPARVHVAEPGVDRAGLAPGTTGGGELLVVAAVLRAKGYDVLVDALGTVADLRWRVTAVGSVARDPDFVGRLRDRAAGAGVAHRLRLAGALARAELDAAYAAADVLVLPSRGETFGLVVTEALARGLPVVGTHVGGLPEALGDGPRGRPGMLVPSEDPAALGDALRRWLTDPGLRGELRARARCRRTELPGWDSTAVSVSRVLTGLA